MTKDCRYSCSSVNDLFTFSIDRIAQSMQEHAEILNELSSAVNECLSLPEGQRQGLSDRLSELIGYLRNVREGVSKAVTEYESVSTCCMARDDYVEALISYYVMAGSKRELEVLRRAGEVMDVRDEISNVKELVEKMKDVLVRLSSIGAGAKGQASDSGPQ